MPTLSAESLLTCWEYGCSRHPLDRALLLYALAAPAEDPDSLADRTIGERNAALLRLRQAMFGDALSCCVDCPECAEPLEFTLSVAALLGQRTERAKLVELDGVRFRMPTTRDLAAIALEPDVALGAHKLLQLLVEPPQQAGENVDVRPAEASEPLDSDTLANHLSHALEQADACLVFTLDLSCTACAHVWTATFDIGAHLWHEIDAHSRRLLDEIHILARSYGWTEREVLDLSDARRRSYIERALA
jgi:hypothetical protein